MKFILILLTCITAAHLADAAFFTNSATADSFVRAAAPTLNYGGAGALSVSGSNSVNGSGVANGAFDSFIRFNTAAMVTNFNSLFGSNNWAVSGAKLHVTELGAPANTLFNRGIGAFEIRWITNDNWIEGTNPPTAPMPNGIAFNDESTLLNAATDAHLGIFTNAGADVALSFSLTLPAAFTDDLKAGGDAGLFLTAIDSGIGFTFDSRSFGTASARPSLEVSAVPQPGITSISLSETNVVILASNGVTGSVCYILTSTDLTLPRNQWSPVATNVLTANGSFNLIATNAVGTGTSPQQFFILQTQ